MAVLPAPATGENIDQHPSPSITTEEYDMVTDVESCISLDSYTPEIDDHPVNCICLACEPSSGWLDRSFASSEWQRMLDESAIFWINAFETPTPYEHSPISMEMAGRGDEDHEFKDLRSASRARKRMRTEREKYYGYRGVKRGQIGLTHFQESRWIDSPQILLSEREQIVMTKPMLYREAQYYPRPPTYSKPRHKRRVRRDLVKWELRLEQKRDLSFDLPRDVEDATEQSFQYFVHGVDLLGRRHGTPSSIKSSPRSYAVLWDANGAVPEDDALKLMSEIMPDPPVRGYHPAPGCQKLRPEDEGMMEFQARDLYNESTSAASEPEVEMHNSAEMEIGAETVDEEPERRQHAEAIAAQVSLSREEHEKFLSRDSSFGELPRCTEITASDDEYDIISVASADGERGHLRQEGSENQSPVYQCKVA